MLCSTKSQYISLCPHRTRPKRRKPSSQCTRLLTWDSTSWRSTPAESPRPKARSTFHLWPPSCSRFVYKGCYESISNMFQGATEGLRRAKSLRSRTAGAPKRWLLSMGRRGDCPGFSSLPFFLPKPCCSPYSLACFDASRDLVTTLGSCSMFEEEDRREIFAISSDKEGILMDLADSRLYLKVLSVMKKADIESTINLCPILTT